ncbi:hypothetical protein KAR91_22125 [Candidatus Pacearchaeota archaeon]|nr:hypothetical protein [Candidatus Pacearchaeota archaeon]
MILIIGKFEKRVLLEFSGGFIKDGHVIISDLSQQYRIFRAISKDSEIHVIHKDRMLYLDKKATYELRQSIKPLIHAYYGVNNYGHQR